MWIWLLVAFLLGGFALWWNRQQDGMVRRDAVDNARKSVEQAERTARNTTRKLKVDIGGSDTAANSLFDSANSATAAPTETQTAAVSTPVEPAPEIVAPASPDDLTRIDGIGPKFQEVLYTAGIKTFAQLATQTEAQLLDLLKAAGMRKPSNIGTWATQATFAAKGDWNGLSDYLAESEDDE